MVVAIDLQDLLASEISIYCSKENISFTNYLAELVADAFFTKKYGDLNEIMGVSKLSNVTVASSTPLQQPIVEESTEAVTKPPHIDESVIEKSSEEEKTVPQVTPSKRVKRKLNAK